MEFWLALAALLGLTMFALLRGLSRGRRLALPEGDDKAFYHAQTAEIERQAKAGQLGTEEAEAAKAEAARRLIAAASKFSGAASADPGARNAAALAVLILLPAFSLGAYLRYGSPGLADAPLASRAAPPLENFDLIEAIARIEAHLAKNPEDGKGHAVVAPVYMKSGRFADAARAYEAALRFDGETPERQAGYGEALMFREQGVVTRAAKAAFARALALDAKLDKPRFYLGLAASQDGNAADALKFWKPLRDETQAPALRQRLDEEIAKLEPAPAGAAIAALPETERNNAIRGMVDGLETRLAQNGGSAEEWLRLVRALGVLGQRERAAAALLRAREALKDNASGIESLAALASELKLPEAKP